ncbi:MAG TPA: hypothetical protein VK709_20040 [Candidatus Saccharimonadales bacterium]|jgi:hypothetical protein|nr:hypothetical protein [Candidatus Saccharimonadales bacterium]
MPVIDQISCPSESTPKDQSHKSHSTKGVPVELQRTILFDALAIVLLLWVALYNGYPTLTLDTGSYILTGAFHVALPPFRAPGYSAFIRLTSFGISAWPTVAAQAIIVVYVLRLTFVHLIDGDKKYTNRSFLVGVCVLAGLSSLPWMVSELMPYVFAGVLFLSGFLLAFADELRVAQRILLALILMISVASHVSLFVIAALYLTGLAALKFAAHRSHGLSTAQSVLGWLLVPVIAAGIWTATQNQKMGQGFRLSPSTNTFLMGRLFGDGLAQEFLHENCPKRPFVSCQFLSNLPRGDQEFLWQHPMRSHLEGHEIDTIVRETILSYPLKFLTSIVKNTLLQLVSLRTGQEMRMGSADKWNFDVIRKVFPHDLRAFVNDRQFLDTILPVTDVFSRVHVAIFWLSVPLCLLFAWTGQFARINKFLVSAIVLLISNAAVCGGLSAVNDFYQSRVAWIMPLCLTAYICCLFKDRKGEVALTQ